MSNTSQIISKSHRVIAIFLKGSLKYGKKICNGPLLVITNAQKRSFCQKVHNGNKTIKDLVHALDLLIERKQVQAILRAKDTLQWSWPFQRLRVSPFHVQRHKKWAQEYVWTPIAFWKVGCVIKWEEIQPITQRLIVYKMHYLFDCERYLSIWQNCSRNIAQTTAIWIHIQRSTTSNEGTVFSIILELLVHSLVSTEYLTQTSTKYSRYCLQVIF